MEDRRRLLQDLFHAAVAAVDARESVKKALQSKVAGKAPIEVIALGKAATGMTQGALDVQGDRISRALVVMPVANTRHQHFPPNFEYIEAAHPIPDHRSFVAGQRLLTFLGESPPAADYLFLISGGTSSLIETPIRGIVPDEIMKLNRWLLGSGLDIRAMNAIRKAVSGIKGGGLLNYVGSHRATALYISDVPGDRIADIGSGPLGPVESHPLPPVPEWVGQIIAKAEQPAPVAADVQIERTIVAKLADAIAGAAAEARKRGFKVSVHEQRLEGEAEKAGRSVAKQLLDAPPGIHIWGGETVVRLPPNPGRGGRSQSLALGAAIELEGRQDIMLLAAGTDGKDGPGNAAGAIIDGGTVGRGRDAKRDAEQALAHADAGAFLEATGDLLCTGPTGTNVMDVVIACVRQVGAELDTN
ncbi:MAG TPA: DUF4147 domain-containing protein [Gammaproteobacteria bacterium]|nr:DUF4147 domain-containing protein [Gammaproteobacteria bacterium]